MLLEQRYGLAVDWWAFGVLLYEMLFAMSPFRGEDDDETFDSILSGEPIYPVYDHREFVSIVRKVFHECSLSDIQLLTKDPEKRLGSGSTDALEVMAHPYFSKISFDDIYQKRVPPPFIPTLQSATDTSNFDSHLTSEPPVLTPVDSGLRFAESS